MATATAAPSRISAVASLTTAARRCAKTARVGPNRNSDPRYRVFWRPSAPTRARKEVSVPFASRSLAPLGLDEYFDTLWSPMAPDSPLHHMLDEFSTLTKGHGVGALRSVFPVNVLQSPDAYHLTAELPGISEGDVSVSLEGRTLTISASKASSSEEKAPADESIKILLAERRIRKSFSRSFRLPGDVDEEADVSAIMENGVLNVTLPRKGISTPGAREIPVQTGAVSTPTENDA